LTEDKYAYISENYKRIKYNIDETAAKYAGGREVTIVAVTKTVPAGAVNAAMKCGIRVLGESRIQEYLLKKDEYSAEAEIHFIGHLQSNKAGKAVAFASLIQSVDSISLAREIDRQAAKHNKVQDILIEVNIGTEETKSGVCPRQLEELISETARLTNVRVRGLMAIPPNDSSERYFEAMNTLKNDISEKKIDGAFMDILSMGMSGDYMAAVKHGATMVRPGTALFGKREQ